MATKQEKSSVKRATTYTQGNIAPEDFPAELSGEFADLPAQLVQNIGTVAGATCNGGGYFGLSVSDDGGSCRLAVRHGAFALDKRFYALSKFEGALAYCIRKLGEPTA